MDGALALGRFPTPHATDVEDVKLALNLSSAQAYDGSAISVIDISQATQALSLFRQSTANASSYQSHWHASNLPQLTEHLSRSLAPHPSGLPQAVHDLLDSLISSAASSIPSPPAPASPAPSATTSPLSSNLEAWSLRAHTELATSLDAARASKRWRQLSWWKLPWRADDVTLLLGETLERHWLVDAEKGVLFLAGRAAELRLHPSESELYPWLSHHAVAQLDRRATQQAAAGAAPDALPAGATATSTPNAAPSPPWPAILPAARAALATTTVPPLHARAQSLLLSSSSIALSSLALSALTYLSFPVGAFEAGALAALGTVVALRRLQTRWEGARGAWLAALREEGRRALGVVERRVGLDVQAGGVRGEVDGEGDVEEAERERARRAVAGARRALEALDERRTEQR